MEVGRDYGTIWVIDVLIPDMFQWDPMGHFPKFHSNPGIQWNPLDNSTKVCVICAGLVHVDHGFLHAAETGQTRFEDLVRLQLNDDTCGIPTACPQQENFVV